MGFGSEAEQLGRSISVWNTIERTLTARRGAWTLAVIVLLSLAFRVHVSRECSFWLDEAITRQGMLKPGSEILTGPSETHPPLMYWLLAPAIELFGASETGLRAVSLFFGCVLLAAMYELCLELRLSVGHALIVVATFALTPFFLRHATEARHYAIVAAFVTLATTRTLRGLGPQPRARDLVGFAAAALAAGATHYFGVAYAFALLAALVVGLALGWKQSRPPRPLAMLGLLLGLLASLGFLASRALELGRSYDVGSGGTETLPLFDTELLDEIVREFSFLMNGTWSSVIEPGLVLIGITLLSLRLRGIARLLPFGLGLAPCLFAPFIAAEHFVAARYIAPSSVFYHLAACVTLFTAVGRAAVELGRGARPTLLAPLVGWLALASVLVARLREFPSGFGAGGDDYRGLQRYFVSNLAKDTRLVSYLGSFGGLMLGTEYPIGSRPLRLEQFRPVRNIHRYLVIEIHVDGPQRIAEFEALVKRRFGLSQAQWRALPLVPLPHSIYQPAVPARLVELSDAWLRRHAPRKRVEPR
jgi:dolichyl-phosphate-mannose-protein mannosyltransferase